MAKTGGYTLSSIYQGGYSSLKPSYGDVFTGYNINAGGFGLTTDPRTANVLQEVSKNLATGVKQIEISAIQPEVFESIPKQHLKEINRLSKLTGVDISVHGPIVEASGLTQKEGFTETNRKAAERQMISAVEKSHEINPDGNIPVTFHSSVMLPGKIGEKGKKAEEMLVINRETGGINRIPIKEEKHFPGEEDKKKLKTEGEIIQIELNKANEESWLQNLSHLSYENERGGELIDAYGTTAEIAESEETAGREINEKEKRAKQAFAMADTFLNNAYRQFKGTYESAYEYAATDNDKETIKKLGDQITQKVEKINDSKSMYDKALLKREVIDEGIGVLKNMTPPEILTEIDSFAKGKTVQTFANIAFESYKKFKDNSPIISIENPPAGGGFSTGEELKEVVEKAREEFVKRAMKADSYNLPKDQRGLGMSKNQAQQAAKKILGVTWDVGHINMLRKYGYEDKDIVKETEAVAPLVKHIHLSDNFGFEHTELPMGMGNVPIKEILEKIGKQGFDAKKIIEAGNWWQHFKTPPFKETLEAFGSPIYSMNMAPYWNQSLGLQQGYMGGMSGEWLPQMNYETFGAGFSQLPNELGGQRPGAQGSRMSGKPME